MGNNKEMSLNHNWMQRCRDIQVKTSGGPGGGGLAALGTTQTWLSYRNYFPHWRCSGCLLSLQQHDAAPLELLHATESSVCSLQVDDPGTAQKYVKQLCTILSGAWLICREGMHYLELCEMSPWSGFELFQAATRSLEAVDTAGRGTKLIWMAVGEGGMVPSLLGGTQRHLSPLISPRSDTGQT